MMMEGNELHLSSLIQASSPWKQKTTSSFLSKIVKMQNDTSAILLREDSNKTLRFAYLSLLMSRKNAHYMQTLIAKMGQITTSRTELELRNLPPIAAKLLPTKTKQLHTQMHQLAKKMENHGWTHTTILKLSHQFTFVDCLMIAVFRTIAEDCKMSNALDWNISLGLNQTDALLTKITMEKETNQFGLSGRNKFVLFFPLTELQLQFFKSREVVIAKESECYEELSDNQTVRYQDFLMIEKIYSLL